MTITVQLWHRTSYIYDRPVMLWPHVVRLRPAPHARTPVHGYSLKAGPAEHFLNWQQDAFANWQARLVFPEQASRLDVEVRLNADMVAINAFDFFLDEDAQSARFAYDPQVKADLAPYLVTPEEDADLDAFLKAAPAPEGVTIDWLVALNQFLQSRIAYTVRLEPGVQSPGDTVRKALGSCRDSGWLLVAMLRRFGYAARFVSGYLVQLAADMEAVDGPSGPKEDFTDLHAWAEVYLPGAGWVGLDPTSGLFAGEGHIPLAATPAPASAAPITGAHGPAEVSFDFEMSVTRLKEPPRITRPMTDAQWRALDATGQEVDRVLHRHDVRLTQGGEPTFVSATDRDAEEWLSSAVGPTKRLHADQLIRRLQARFAPGGVVQHGQGKWYPGEPLPRWAFALIWSGDGRPLWSDLSRLGTEGQGQSGAEEAGQFMAALTDALGVDRDCGQPVFEDPSEAMLREHGLPEDVTPDDPRLMSAEGRAALARLWESRIGEPAAFVLPLQLQQARAQGARRFQWGSEKWITRRSRLFLHPGDSPAGFRLPLGSLRQVVQDEVRAYHDPLTQSPMPAPAPAPSPAPVQAATPSKARRPGNAASIESTGSSWLETGETLSTHPDYARTALTIEPRDGHLCVFLPPLASGEAWEDLLAALDEASRQTGLPIRLEGYEPPFDTGLNVIRVTPDPGVIEVNIHPATNWQSLAEITEALNEEARQCGLDTTSFQIDGRPTGSGGGNHIVLGGASPADSPFLRRPDLLGSLIRYWQRHPSLSYLFSGMFIGPTSQAPRLDEARHDALYEMEIALKELDRAGDQPPPWLVDRLFRNLLTDATGNTHRSEICIDKLYAPDSPTGRLGLLEFRGFEMPPHWQMSLAQSLVIRALIAWFWAEPCRAPLKPLGTELHDRYLLPTPLWQDFNTVLDDLSKAHGLVFDPAWFEAQFDFRFPRAGRTEVDGVAITLRNAIEPWLVLGEEGAIGGTARYVDSSVERIEVLTQGLDPERHDVLCNGVRVPMTALGQGQHVAGIRFRSWQPWKAMHPTIPAHGPLAVQLWDKRASQPLGGCTYHVAHPGGRAHEDRPINALAAEGRRLARFFDGAFWIEGALPQHVGVHPDFPMTLDLRRL